MQISRPDLWLGKDELRRALNESSGRSVDFFFRRDAVRRLRTSPPARRLPADLYCRSEENDDILRVLPPQPPDPAPQTL